MSAGSSPATSDTISDIIRAGHAAEASCPPLYEAKVFAHDVHLANRRTGGEQRRIDGLFLGKGDLTCRLNKQRRSPA